MQHPPPLSAACQSLWKAVAGWGQKLYRLVPTFTALCVWGQMPKTQVFFVPGIHLLLHRAKNRGTAQYSFHPLSSIDLDRLPAPGLDGASTPPGCTAAQQPSVQGAPIYWTVQIRNSELSLLLHISKSFSSFHSLRDSFPWRVPICLFAIN